MNKTHAFSLSVVAVSVIMGGASVALAQQGPGDSAGGGQQGQRMMPPPPGVNAQRPGEMMRPGEGRPGMMGSSTNGQLPMNREGMRPPFGEASSTMMRPPMRDASSTFPMRPPRDASSTMPMRPPMGEGDREVSTSTVSAKQLQRMLKQTASMANLFARNIKQLQTAQTKLTKLGLAFPAECKQAITDGTTLVTNLKAAQDTSTVKDLFENAADVQDTLQGCRDDAQRLTQAPVILKSLQRMIDRLKKAQVDVTALQTAFNNDVQSAYNKLKDTSVTGDDVQSFFDAADSFRDDLSNAFDGAGITSPRELNTIDGGNKPLGNGPQSFLGIQNGLANLGAAIMAVTGIK